MVLPAGDGVVTLRPFSIGDRPVIVAQRDAEWERWLGPGGPDPAPTACIDVGGQVVGWVDADPDPEWLEVGEANVGYAVFSAHRGKGYAARAVRLLLQALDEPGLRRAVLVIDVGNRASLRVARAVGAELVPGRSLPHLPTAAVYGLDLRRHDGRAGGGPVRAVRRPRAR